MVRNILKANGAEYKHVRKVEAHKKGDVKLGHAATHL